MIPEYDLMGGTEDQWQKAREWMEAIDLSEIDNGKLLAELENMVKEIFNKKVFCSKTSEGTDFKSKNRIPREVRKLFKAKSRYSSILYNVKTSERSRTVLNKLINVEKELKNRERKRTKKTH